LAGSFPQALHAVDDAEALAQSVRNALICAMLHAMALAGGA
jgi:hypothetical protein